MDRSEMKSITHNVPDAAHKAEFGDEANLTADINGVTVYFDEIREERHGYIFTKGGLDAAYVPEEECDVSPLVARDWALENPNEDIPFADE